MSIRLRMSKSRLTTTTPRLAFAVNVSQPNPLGSARLESPSVPAAKGMDTVVTVGTLDMLEMVGTAVAVTVDTVPTVDTEDGARSISCQGPPCRTGIAGLA